MNLYRWKKIEIPVIVTSTLVPSESPENINVGLLKAHIRETYANIVNFAKQLNLIVMNFNKYVDSVKKSEYGKFIQNAVRNDRREQINYIAEKIGLLNDRKYNLMRLEESLDSRRKEVQKMQTDEKNANLPFSLEKWIKEYTGDIIRQISKERKMIAIDTDMILIYNVLFETDPSLLYYKMGQLSQMYCFLRYPVENFLNQALSGAFSEFPSSYLINYNNFCCPLCRNYECLWQLFGRIVELYVRNFSLQNSLHNFGKALHVISDFMEQLQRYCSAPTTARCYIAQTCAAIVSLIESPFIFINIVRFLDIRQEISFNVSLGQREGVTFFEFNDKEILSIVDGIYKIYNKKTR